MINRAAAGELSGIFATDVRAFPNKPAWAEQSGNTLSPSVFFKPEYRAIFNGERDRLTAIPFYRWDGSDSRRTHFDIRELNWYHKGLNWDMRLGVGRVFWGVAESRHLVDIINQVDFVEDFDEEDRLGQPMLNVNLIRSWGSVSLFLLPHFRERTFPGARGRLRFEFPVDTENPRYESDNGPWHVDFAGRFSKTFGDWDVGLSHFWGTGREPRLVFDRTRNVLIPHYDLINQTGLDIQGSKGNWLLKFEGMVRDGQGPRFAAVVTGVEYTCYGVFGTSADVGLLGEYLYDGRSQPVPPEPSAPPTPFDDDFYVGARLALNDTQSSELLAGVTIDRKDQEMIFSIEASRRIQQNWKLELEARFFSNVNPDQVALAGFAQDDYVQLRLIRYLDGDLSNWK